MTQIKRGSDLLEVQVAVGVPVQGSTGAVTAGVQVTLTLVYSRQGKYVSVHCLNPKHDRSNNKALEHRTSCPGCLHTTAQSLGDRFLIGDRHAR